MLGAALLLVAGSSSPRILTTRFDDLTLHDVYLPHFKRVLDAGVASIMSAYNKVNGKYCGHNAELLTSILRDEWSFEGFVHSD